MTVSTFDRQNIGEIIAGHGTWFTAELLRLIHKADADNKARLRLAYPETVAAYDAWANGPGDEL